MVKEMHRVTITCIRYVFFNYISKDTYGDRKRSFKAEWDKIYSWLEYSRILDTDIVMPVNILALPIAQSRFLRVVSKTGRRQPTRKVDLEFMQDQSTTSKPWLHGKTMRQQ